MGIDALCGHAQDAQTLIIELINPTPYFLELLALPAFFPIHHQVDQKNPTWAQNSATHVGNGPFVLSNWKHRDCLELKKNENYWDAAQVKIESLELSMLSEEIELKLFEKKQLDWAGSPLSTLPVDALEKLKEISDLNTQELLGTYFIRINTERAPFNHPLMRKAFALAIDRKSIVEHVTRGNQIPATGLVPLALGIQQTPYFQDADEQAATALFKKSLADQKLKKEKLPEIVLMYRAGERSHLIAQAVQQQWFSAFGLRVKLEAVEGKIYLDRLSKQDFHMAAGSWIADFADPINFLEVFKYKNGSNNTHWENARFTELLDQSLNTKDKDARMEILSQSEQILMEEMPIIPIFYYTMLYINQPHLKDVVLTPMGQIDFKWASLEEQPRDIK